MRKLPLPRCHNSNCIKSIGGQVSMLIFCGISIFFQCNRMILIDQILLRNNINSEQSRHWNWMKKETEKKELLQTIQITKCIWYIYRESHKHTNTHTLFFERYWNCYGATLAKWQSGSIRAKQDLMPRCCALSMLNMNEAKWVRTTRHARTNSILFCKSFFFSYFQRLMGSFAFT